MKVGTGKTSVCLDNISGGSQPPEPSQGDRGDADPVLKTSSTSSRYVTVPIPSIQDPYAGMNRYQLIEILTWAWSLNQDPRYPELFRQAWLRAADQEAP